MKNTEETNKKNERKKLVLTQKQFDSLKDSFSKSDFENLSELNEFIIVGKKKGFIKNKDAFVNSLKDNPKLILKQFKLHGGFSSVVVYKEYRAAFVSFAKVNNGAMASDESNQKIKVKYMFVSGNEKWNISKSQAKKLLAPDQKNDLKNLNNKIKKLKHNFKPEKEDDLGMEL